jgi:hypothetical protein
MIEIVLGDVTGHGIDEARQGADDPPHGEAADDAPPHDPLGGVLDFDGVVEHGVEPEFGAPGVGVVPEDVQVPVAVPVREVLLGARTAACRASWLVPRGLAAADRP